LEEAFGWAMWFGKREGKEAKQAPLLKNPKETRTEGVDFFAQNMTEEMEFSFVGPKGKK
jgi:hypothetical protein